MKINMRMLSLLVALLLALSAPVAARAEALPVEPGSWNGPDAPADFVLMATAEPRGSENGASGFAVMPTAPPIDYAGITPDDARAFVLLTDAVPDAILEIRYYSTYNFVGERIDGYEQPVALLTREATEALRAVSDDAMARGYRLKIFDAYRPQTAVDHFVRWAQDTSDTRMKPYFYPDVKKSELFARDYIAKKSGHSRGSTVDLTLFDMAAGREADMGGPFDFFGELSHPDYRGVTDAQYANRMLLRELMLAHGFKPLSSEWWHFTLKDEPFPKTYFTFPVRADSVSAGDWR